MKTPSLLPLALCVIALGGCSSQLAGTGSCLERDDCDQPQVATQGPTAGFWYCYGAARDEPWDCSNTQDDSKIRIIPGPLPDDEEAYAAAVRLPEDAAPAPRPSLKPEGFAVQLVALDTVSAVEEFALEHGLDDPVYFRIRGPEQPLYVLILGYYGSREEAQQAATEWEALHQTGEEPLIKPVEALQAAMETADSP